MSFLKPFMQDRQTRSNLSVSELAVSSDLHEVFADNGNGEVSETNGDKVETEQERDAPSASKQQQDTTEPVQCQVRQYMTRFSTVYFIYLLIYLFIYLFTCLLIYFWREGATR